MDRLWNSFPEEYVEALLTDTLVSGRLYLRPPSQNAFFLNSHTNSVFLHSRKRPASVTDTFFASRGCPLKRASTILTVLAYTGRLRSIIWKGRNFPCWSMRKGREICHFGQRKGSKGITDALVYGCQNVENWKHSVSVFYIFIFKRHCICSS